MKLRWSHAVLYVRDLEEMLDFYGKVLGFEVSDRGLLDRNNPDSPEVAFITQVGSDHHQLAFAPVRGEGPSTTLDHIAFKVDSFADVKEMIERLEKDGRASDVGTITHGNAWSVYFKDPEENTVEVFCDTPFHVQQPQFLPWDSKMNEDELLAFTKEQFEKEPKFGPIDEFYAAQRKRFGS